MKTRFLLLAFCCLLLGNCSDQSEVQTENTVIFHIMQQVWHTGLVLDVSTIPDSLRALAYFKRENHYIEVGWGDEAFFQYYSSFNFFIIFIINCTVTGSYLLLSIPDSIFDLLSLPAVIN
jgi:hypothetical protein